MLLTYMYDRIENWIGTKRQKTNPEKFVGQISSMFDFFFLYSQARIISRISGNTFINVQYCKILHDNPNLRHKCC